MTQQQLKSQTDSNKNQVTKADLKDFSPADIQNKDSDIIPYLKKELRLGFSGLTPNNSGAYPDRVDNDFPGRSDNPYSFTEVIEILPDADYGQLESVNKFVDRDGSIDVSGIEETLDTDISNLVHTLNDNGVRRQPVDEYREIIDTRRQALAALGYDVKYRWQIATNSYTIINPQDAYYSAYKTFLNEGEGDSIFGWVDIRNWGGNVDLYILFENHELPIPGGDEDALLGIRTGYDYEGGRTLEAQIFGYDPNKNVRMYRLGEKRSRRHQGNPTNTAHEKENNRTPIGEWWQIEYDVISREQDDLFEDIERASKKVIDFTEFDFTIEEFYEYLGIPQSYITGQKDSPGTVDLADRYSSPSPQYTIWTLYYALSTTLEREFQGSNHAGKQFKVYADLARGLLRTPERTLKRVKDEYEERKDDDNNDEEVDLFEKADNVDISISERKDITQEKQKDLFSYRED